MSKNEFDELLLKKLQEEELEYNPAHWDRLAQLLPPTLTPASVPKGKKWAIAAGIAAAVAVALATVFFIKLLNSPKEETVQPTVAQQTKVPGNTIQPGNNTATTVPGHRATPHNVLSAPVTQQQIAAQQPAANPVINHPHPVPANTPTLNDQSILPGVLDPGVKAQEAIAGNKIAREPIPQVKETAPANNNMAAVAKEPETYAYNNPYTASAFYEGKHPGKETKRTSVSLGGGVNYGNLNTGYTAGVSVRRKVAGDFFVDGSVAMMYNNNANNVAINNGPPLSDNKSNTAAKPTAFNNETNLASPALDPIQKLYYVQFNPSIGYQVEKHVALSVGGDFQQILNKRGEQDEIVQPGTNSSKVFPNFDVGLTAKSEFSITPSIQAGLVYREGLNNVLKNEGSKYVNRRYIQVQFKYNLPVN